jgi:hypothetical protein
VIDLATHLADEVLPEAPLCHRVAHRFARSGAVE